MTVQRPRNGESVARLNPRPLYLQVKEDLVRRMVAGEWPPGAGLPSEMKLAQDYNVSQGTIRKAIDGMAADNLITRFQGKGSFVNSHTHTYKPFRFYRLCAEDGEPAIAETVFLDCAEEAATERDEAVFGHEVGRVARARRLRSVNGAPATLECITLRADICPGLGELLDRLRPNSIYSILEMHYNVLIVRVSEQVRATEAEGDAVPLLKVSDGKALIRVERRAYSLNGQVVEHREVLSRPDLVHYRNKIG